jgi:hypothetical protein
MGRNGRGSIPCKGKNFVSSPKCPQWHQGPCQWVMGFFLGAKKTGCEVNYSPPLNAEVINKWCYTSTPPISLHCVDMDNFTFIHNRLMTNKTGNVSKL